MEHIAPRPDGLPMEFYQKFWGVIKNDLMALFSQFKKWRSAINQTKLWGDHTSA